MHPDLERLIKMAGEGAGLTEKKRSIILKKAEELGEDMAEVEMMLENLAETSPQKKVEPQPLRSSFAEMPAESQPVQPTSRRRKCPNCGNTISDYTLTCPQCGYVLESQSVTSSKVQEYINQFNERMLDVENKELFGKVQKKIDLVNGFNVPVTKEALVLGFTYAKAQFQSANNVSSQLAAAWLAKCQQFMDLLKSQTNLDDATKTFIANNEPFLTRKDLIRTGKGCASNIGKWLVYFFIFWLIMLIIGLNL